MAQSGQSTPASTTQTQVGQESGAHPTFPPFDVSTFPSQLVWFAIAFGFLYWYMAKRGLPQLGAVIDGRKALIARDLDEATAMQQKADAAAAAHEKTLAEARAKAQSLAQGLATPPRRTPRRSDRRSRTSLPPSSPPPSARSRQRAPPQ